MKRPVSDCLGGVRVTLPSSRKAAGQPTDCFQRVIWEQNMLSRFQIRNPNAKVAAPEENKRAMVVRWA